MCLLQPFPPLRERLFFIPLRAAPSAPMEPFPGSPSPAFLTYNFRLCYHKAKGGDAS